MPCSSRIGVPWRKRASGVTSKGSCPRAFQSRCASSSSLSDLEIQTARLRPLSQLSSTIPATCRPLPAPVPSPRNQPLRNRTAVVAVIERGFDLVPGRIDGPAAGEVVGMGFARIDHRFQLGVGQQPLCDEASGQMWAVARLGRRDRGHRRGLHQSRRMWLSASDADRLERVGLIERFGELAARRRTPVDHTIVHRHAGCRRDRGCSQSRLWAGFDRF